ncbi:MAG: metallophosphoesterase, partial [Planctomycetales bacterium]
MKAILSEVFGNLEALEAVVEDVARHDVDAVYCLGNVLGYGASPLECLDLAMDMDAVLLGNFETAVLFCPEGMPYGAKRSVYWTREVLESEGDQQTRERRFQFLADLPRRRQEQEALFVSSSPRHWKNEFVFPHDASNSAKMENVGRLFSDCCFHARTCIPGIMVENAVGSWEWVDPMSNGAGRHLDNRKTLCNVGSVGQP